MSKGKEAGKIQVYVRVRPFTEREKDKREVNAIEIHQEHSLIRVLDPRSRTNYFFDGVFSPEASNQEVYLKVGKPLVYAALNGYKGTLLTYGQTGTGKTFTLLSDDGVTTRVVQHCFEKIASDEIHNYKVMCSFLQVYQEKVYDLLNPRFTVDLPVREHPKKGVYVANLTQHEVKSAGDVFALLEIGKQHLVIAETKMVRHSSRSHSIMQLIIERRLKAHIANEKPPTQSKTSVSHEVVQESIMAVDETINNLIKELKQERKSHHKRERECLKELMEKELNNGNNFEGDLIVKGKINLCDLAGSERLTKTKAEGVRLTEAKYLNTSLLELGNVIHALARGHKRHVPYRNSTLTRLLQDCLGDNGKTNFIICIAPSLGEVNETKCSLNFGLRAMRITNVARLNVEVDYKVLAERLAKKLEDQEIKNKFEKLEYLREIQRLKSAISCYQESENFAGKDHEKLVTVIANLSKSVQREKEEKNNLQTELVCLKKQVSQPIGTSAPDVEAVLLAELMSMELLANLQNPDAAKGILSDGSLSAKVKSHLALADTQETLLNNAGCFLQLLDLHLDTELDANERKRAASEAKEYLQFNFSRAGSVELFSKDCSIKISPRGVPKEPCLSLPMYNSSPDENSSGLAGGVRRMLGKLMGRESKDRTSVSPGTHSSSQACSVPSGDVTQRVHDQEETMIKTKALLTRLTSSKEKVEQQVLGLLSTLFDEQIAKNEGQCPQWNELGNKLTKLIMFRRNNMPGLSEADMWANSEDLNAILENCLRFVIIDKALLACLLVIELLELRQVCGTLEEKRKLPTQNAPGESTAMDSSPQSTPPIKTTGSKKNSSNSKEIESISPTASISPRREKLKSLKHTKTELEKEITEMHEDTTFLETELFSTMEERTKVEEELYGIKSHVTKLRSELFHLKLEKSNLESDVKKSKSQENLEQSEDSDGAKSTFESPKEPVPRGYPELSDVLEASHESNDSENSSQMSDGNETREAFLKTCMENISKIYTLMPENAEEIASEDEMSDEQEPTLSDANIDDSDEEIIITKLARSLRSPCASPNKEKVFETSPPYKSGQKQAVVGDVKKDKSNTGNEVNEDIGNKSRDALIKQIQELKRKLHKAENELNEAREANEDLEEELDHKKGQLAEAQVTITNLENQIVDEKETCEEVRQQYFNVKTQNEILDGKLKALRSETERLLRDSNSSNAVFRSPESSRRDNPPLSPTKTKAKSPLRSPTKAKVPKIDLRTPPQKQVIANEIEFISLVEENAELKVKLGNATQEKTRLEKSLKIVEEKSFKLKTVIQTSEDACSRIKEEVSAITKEKVRLSGEITDLRNTNSSMAEELQKYREKSTRLEKDIEAIAYMSTRLEKNNKILEMEISKMESELCSWKTKHESMSQECQRLDQENQIARKDREKALLELGAIKKEKSQLLEQRFSINEETVRREKQLKDKEERFFELEVEVTEQKRLNANLQKELAGMAEYQEALESEYSKAKNEEDKLKQELARISSRVIEVETELASASQNTQDYGLSIEQKSNSLSLRTTLKDEPSHRGKSFSGTPSKKFYTITHTSEDEIADTSSSIAESPADESKQVEHENQLLKLENGYLQQQLAESEHVLALYRQDLESAHDLIDKLQAEMKIFTDKTKNDATEDDCKTPSDKDDTVQEIEGCSAIANEEYRLLEEKHAELTREYEILRQHYQEAVTEKEGGNDREATANAALKKVTFVGEKASKKITKSQRDVVHPQNTLHDRIKELESENMKLKVAEEELEKGLNANNQLIRSLEDAKRVQTTLEERIANYESERKDNKLRQTYMEEQVARLKEENEKSRAEVLERTISTSHPLNHQQTAGDVLHGKRAVDNENKLRTLEEDLLKATSEKLKLEFELRSANADCERLKSDLHQSESERNLLTTQLNDNIERAANLEIRLMEMRCSCETIKDEINSLKNQKRQESFHLHEASVCKEILEKRLEDALKENNSLHHELEAIREEREETIKKTAKLEEAKEKLIKEINEVKKQKEVEQKIPDRPAQENKKADVPIDKEVSEESNEHRKLHREDQEQVTILQDELRKITEDHNQLKEELQEIKVVKEILEQQIEIIKVQGLMENEDALVSNFKLHTTKEEQQEMTTNDEMEIEEKTKLLEKEKGLLEKELTRVQGECNKLKKKLALGQSQVLEDQRNENEERQEHLKIELQRLRDLNKELENECEGSNKLIHELEIKTKALESLEKELHCFHEENDRLTQEVDIIQHTSKAITDHQSSKESLEAEKSLLKKELENIHDCNRTLQEKIEDMGKELEIVNEQREKVSSIEKMNASLNNEIEKLQTMHQHLESELATTHGKIKEMEIVNDTLKKENKALKGRINNEAHRMKDDHRKVSRVENKLKDTSKQELSIAKEGKAVSKLEGKNDEDRENDLQQTVEQLASERSRLKDEQDSVTKNNHNLRVPDKDSQSVTVLKETTEPQSENEEFEELTNNKLTGSRDQETNTESENEKESAPFAEDVKAGLSLMAKENLLLEKKASYFVRAQVQLEQSLSKAMKENLSLKNKVSETENVLTILRERVHELEKNSNSSALPLVDLKKSVMLSSDSESDCDANELPNSGNKKKGQRLDDNSAALQENTEERNKMRSCHEGSAIHSVPSNVDKLQRELEEVTKELENLKSQKEIHKIDSKEKKDSETQSEKEDNLLHKQEEENTLLKQERQSLLEELEAATNQKKSIEHDLRQNKESCIKQEQEIKLLLSSYSQEKESLLKELESTRLDCRKVKEKLRGLQQIDSEFADIQKKSTEAEKLVTELEKELLCQTEMKNELKRELQNCQNKLQEIEHLETKLRSCRTEIEDLHSTNNQLREDMEKKKDENNNLIDELKNVKIKLRSLEKQKKQSMNRDAIMKNSQDQSVQTDSGADVFVHRDQEVPKQKTQAKDVEETKNTMACRESHDINSHKVFPQSDELLSASRKSNEGVDNEAQELNSSEIKTRNEGIELGDDNRFQGFSIPIIIITQEDDTVTINNESTTGLNLFLGDFEKDSPNDQSTPDEENQKNTPSITTIDDVEPSVDKQIIPLEISSNQELSAVKSQDQRTEENVITMSDSEKNGLQNQRNGSNKQEVSAEPEIGSKKDDSTWSSLQKDVQQDDALYDGEKEEPLSLSSRREYEWTISNLKSELQQRSEDHERNQQEIGSLEEQQLSMKREIVSLLSECESLRAKVALLQTQNEAVLKEQILNDEENEELQQNMQDILEEKNSIEEAKKKLESEKARLEIELSDAIETREAVEGELLRFRTENATLSQHTVEGQLYDISERYAKLETVLSCVLDENSKMTAELSALKAENGMLKSFKIMEITDNCTQFSPRTTEDESDGEGTHSLKRRKSTLSITRQSRLSEDLTNQLYVASPKSTGTDQVKGDEEGTTTDEFPVTPTPAVKVNGESDFDRFGDEQRQMKKDEVPTSIEDDNGREHRAAMSGELPSLLPLAKRSLVENTELEVISVGKSIRKKHQRKTLKESSSRKKHSKPDDADKVDSDDHDSSMEVHTSSSLVSITDLDISISSDQISSEDSSLVGPEIRVLQRMQKELAETKCSNVLVKNELSIIRKHNADLQNQVQKLLSRNNHLKTRMCDKALSVKRMEKEVSNIQDENNKLQQQAMIFQDEMARVEKEKAKFERNMSATKSENKRLKSDLSNIKAESYRTMKELVNLQSENRKLQLEIERLKEDSRRLNGPCSDDSTSHKVPFWGTMSPGDRSTSRRSLQEKQVKQNTTHLYDATISDLTFSHRQTSKDSQGPELSPLNLSEELQKQDTDDDHYGKTFIGSADSISSEDRSRSSELVSRRGSQLSFTSEASHPGEGSDRNEIEHQEKTGDEHEDEQGGKGKSKKKIKTILRKFQHSKKTKSSK